MEFLQLHVLEIAIGISLLGLLQVLYRYIAAKNQTSIEAVIIDVKKNTSTKGARRNYCYPVVEVIEDEDGTIKKVYCSTAKKSGHSYYDSLQMMEMYKVRNILGRTKYIPVIGYWQSSIKILTTGLVIIIVSMII